MASKTLLSFLLLSTILLLTFVASIQGQEKDEAQKFIDDLISNNASETTTITEETNNEHDKLEQKEEAPLQTGKRMVDGIKNLEAKFKELKMKHQLMREQKKRDATEEGGSTAASSSGSAVAVGDPWFQPIPVICATFGIVFGILVVGFGYRCYHLTTFGAGCIPTSGFFYLILTIHTSVYTGIALLIGLFVGVAFGVATLLFNPAAHAALGGFTGILIAAVFATTIETVVFDWLVVLIVPIVLAFCGVFMPKQIVIFSTSLCGSYGIMASIDYFGFGAGGFSNFFPKLLSNFENLNPNWMTWLLVFCTLALTLVGLIAQCWFTAKDHEPQPIVDFSLHRTASFSGSSSYEDVADEKDRDSSDSSPSTPRANVRPSSSAHSVPTTAASADPVSVRLATLANLPHPKPPPAPDVRTALRGDPS